MLRRPFALFLILLGIAACAPQPDRASPTRTPQLTSAFPVTLTDFQNQTVVVASRPERIVSIGPSNTEFLFALGAGERVVGVDDYSDEPAAASTKEKVGGVKPNVEKIVSLRPDLVVSVKISDGSLQRIAARSIAVLVVDPVGVPDVARTATLLGKAVGADGEALARSITDGVGAVKAKAAGVPQRRVYHEIDASDPNKLFTVGPGSFIHDLITIAGGVNIAANAVAPYPQLSPEVIVRADPEIIVFAASGTTPEQIAARPGWSVVSAVKNKRIVKVEGSLMSRPGPRLPQAAEAYFRIVSGAP